MKEHATFSRGRNKAILNKNLNRIESFTSLGKELLWQLLNKNLNRIESDDVPDPDDAPEILNKNLNRIERQNHQSWFP